MSDLIYSSTQSTSPSSAAAASPPLPSSSVPSNARRMDQVDAISVDSEFVSILLSLWNRAIENWPHFDEYIYRYQSEANFLFQSLLFYLTIVRRNASFGAQLLNLRLQHSSRQPRDARALRRRTVAALYALTVCAPYAHIALKRWLWSGHSSASAHSRAAVPAQLSFSSVPESSTTTNLFLYNYYYYYLEQIRRHVSTSDARRQTILRVNGWLEGALKVCTVANALAFARRGRYATLAHRALAVRLVYEDAHGELFGASYRYMNKELVWQALASLALCSVPAVQWPAAKERAWRWLRRVRQRALLRNAGKAATLQEHIDSDDVALSEESDDDDDDDDDNDNDDDNERGREKSSGGEGAAATLGGGGNSAARSRRRRRCRRQLGQATFEHCRFDCALCNASPATSAHTLDACAHVFCYYCIADEWRASYAVDIRTLQQGHSLSPRVTLTKASSTTRVAQMKSEHVDETASNVNAPVACPICGALCTQLIAVCT